MLGNNLMIGRFPAFRMAATSSQTLLMGAIVPRLRPAGTNTAVRDSRQLMVELTLAHLEPWPWFSGCARCIRCGPDFHRNPSVGAATWWLHPAYLTFGSGGHTLKEDERRPVSHASCSGPAVVSVRAPWLWPG